MASASTVEAVEPLAVDGRAVADVGLTVEVVGRLDGPDDVQVVGLGEVPVALVLTRDRHDRAGAVAHEHVVGQVQRDRLLGERVDARRCR